MRILFALPVAVLFGCAHQSNAEYQPEPQPSAQAAPTPSPPEAAATPAPAPAPAEAKAKPEPVAGAEPMSTPATCGLVHVRFETDSAALHDDDKSLLMSTADCLKQNKQLRINVEGNADERGTDEHNMELSQERAQAVSQFLESEGVSAQQIKLVSFGEDNPLCTQSDADCWAKNRRTAVRPTCHM